MDAVHSEREGDKGHTSERAKKTIPEIMAFGWRGALSAIAYEGHGWRAGLIRRSMRLFKYTLFFTKMQHLSNWRRRSKLFLWVGDSIIKKMDPKGSYLSVGAAMKDIVLKRIPSKELTDKKTVS